MDVFSFAIDISAETFRDVQGFRRLIEVNLGDTLIGRVREETLAEMETINAKMERTPDPLEAARLDYLFHKALVDAAGNRTLSETYQMLKPVIRKVMETGKSQRRAIDTTASAHAAIVDALRAGDRLAYAYQMSRHLDAGLGWRARCRSGRRHHRLHRSHVLSASGLRPTVRSAKG